MYSIARNTATSAIFQLSDRNLSTPTSVRWIALTTSWHVRYSWSSSSHVTGRISELSLGRAWYRLRPTRVSSRCRRHVCVGYIHHIYLYSYQQQVTCFHYSSLGIQVVLGLRWTSCNPDHTHRHYLSIITTRTTRIRNHTIYLSIISTRPISHVSQVWSGATTAATSRRRSGVSNVLSIYSTRHTSPQAN